jgi:hypothetical protein
MPHEAVGRVGHAHVITFLLFSCELSVFSLSSCFAPNLTPVCERCVLTYSHHFDVFLCGAATINFTFSFHAYFDYNHLE